MSLSTRVPILISLSLALFLAAKSVPAEDSDEAGGASSVSYWRDIRPIFQERCQGCHQPAKKDGDLDITSVEAIKKGGFSEESAVFPDDPDESILMYEITAEEGERPSMPKGGEPLSAEQVARIRRWIAEGARDDSPPATKPTVDMDHPPVYSAPPVVTSLDFSPDGNLLAVSGYHEVLIHNRDGSEIVARLVGLSERIESAVFSPDGKRLAVTGGSPCRLGEVQIWDVEKKELKISHAVTHDTVYGADWSDNGKLVSFGCADNTLRVIDAKKGTQVFYQGAHNDWVLDTVFSAQGTHLVSVSRDGSMKLNEVATQRFVDNITSITPALLRGGLMSVDRHPTKDELLTGGADGVPETYRMFREQARKIGDDFNLIRKFDALPGRIFSVCYNADGSRIAAASSFNGQGEVRVYQGDDGKLISKFALSDGGLFAVTFHPEGKILAAGGFDGSVRLIDVETGELIRVFGAVPLATGQMASTGP
jgi:WD40 repeat protein